MSTPRIAESRVSMNTMSAPPRPSEIAAGRCWRPLASETAWFCEGFVDQAARESLDALRRSSAAADDARYLMDLPDTVRVNSLRRSRRWLAQTRLPPIAPRVRPFPFPVRFPQEAHFPDDGPGLGPQGALCHPGSTGRRAPSEPPPGGARETPFDPLPAAQPADPDDGFRRPGDRRARHLGLRPRPGDDERERDPHRREHRERAPDRVRALDLRIGVQLPHAATEQCQPRARR